MTRSDIETAEVESGEGYFASVSDLMVGILFVFLLMLTVFAMNLRETSEQQTIELEKYKQLQKHAEQLQDEARREKERAEREKERAERERNEARRQQEAALASEAKANRLRSLLEKAASRLSAEVREREEARAYLLNTLHQELNARGVTVRIEEQSGVLRLSTDVPFDVGSSRLTEKTRNTVAVLADVLGIILPCFSHLADRTACDPNASSILETVLVEGHTDRQRFAGMSEAESQLRNDILSTERALNVFVRLQETRPSLGLLQNGDGLPLLGFSGYGQRRPVRGAEGNSESDFAQNRRIDLRFVLSARSSREVEQLIADIKREISR